MITIHIDYRDNTELSYDEGLEQLNKKPEANFTTNVLTFFSNSFNTNVIVVDKFGRSIDKHELMSNSGFKYTDRIMKPSHNIHKMLIANSFTWKQPIKEFYIYDQLLNYDEDKLLDFFIYESKLGDYSRQDKSLRLTYKDIIILLSTYQRLYIAKILSMDVLDALHIAYTNKASIIFNNIRNVKISAKEK